MQTGIQDALVSLLADEAYSMVCCSELQRRLNEVLAQQHAIRISRPRFSFLLRSDQKRDIDDSERRMQEAEQAARLELAKATKVHAAVQQLTREGLESYLDRASPDYYYHHALLDEVQNTEANFAVYADRLRAVAREARSTRLIALDETNEVPRGLTFRNAYSELLLACQNLDAAGNTLEIPMAKLAQMESVLFGCIAVTPVPFLEMTVWCQSIEFLDRVMLARELESKENAMREVLADNCAPIWASYESARAKIVGVARVFLEEYWQQLREFAEKNYVSDVPDMPTIMSMLAPRYLSTPVELRKAESYSTNNPYFCER